MDIDSYDTPEAEALLEVGHQRFSVREVERRVIATEAATAIAFLAAATSLAVIGGRWGSASLPLLAGTLVCYVAAGSVSFPVGSVWTAPTQLVFVPMLFLLPPTLVPLVICAG